MTHLVGFVGLGIMGRPLARNLLEAGHSSVVHRRLAGSPCLDQKTPDDVADSHQPGFEIDLHVKDLGLIMEATRALGVPLPTTAVVQELFSALRVRGRGGLDHAGVITLLEDLAGVSG